MKINEISGLMKSVIDTLKEFGVKKIYFDLGISGGTRIRFTIKK